MAGRRVQNMVQEILEDMDFRIDAEIQQVLRRARHRAPAAWVDDTVDVFKGRLGVYALEAAVAMTPLVGPTEAFATIARDRDHLLGSLDLVADLLEEVSLYGDARDPYVVMRNNPHVPAPAPAPAPRRQRRDISPYVAPRRPEPKPAPKPEAVPGEGPGPKPIPDKKAKKKDIAAWDVGGADNTWDKVNEWGPAENWEDMAMHVANKEKLEIKAKLKTEEEEAAKAAAAKVPVKGAKGKVPAKGVNKPKA